MVTIPVIAESDGMDKSLVNGDEALAFNFYARCPPAPRDVGLERRSVKSPHATRAGLGMVALGQEHDDDYDEDYDDDLDDDEDLDDDDDDDDDLDDDLDGDDDHDPDRDRDEQQQPTEAPTGRSQSGVLDRDGPPAGPNPRSLSGGRIGRWCGPANCRMIPRRGPYPSDSAVDADRIRFRCF